MRFGVILAWTFGAGLLAALTAFLCILPVGRLVRRASTAKTVTFFLDEVSRQNLVLHGIDPRELLVRANQRFAEQNLAIRYDSDSLKVKPWPRYSVELWKELEGGRDRPSPFWVDLAPQDSKYMRIAIEAQDVLLQESAERNTDVIFFFAGNLMLGKAQANYDYLVPYGLGRLHNADMSAKPRDLPELAFHMILLRDVGLKSIRDRFRPNDGNGSVVLGSGMLEKERPWWRPEPYDPLEVPPTRDGIINLFANIIQHEQAHLYGAGHVPADRALMNPIVNAASESYFDESTRALLRGRAN